MFCNKAGTAKLQVLITPAEYRDLRRRAKVLGCSISALARTYLIAQLGTGFIPEEHEDLVAEGKYQPRGFAKRKGA